MNEHNSGEYVVAVQRDFIANHYLVGGDWGAENHPHAHHYQIEVRLIGSELDQHGYLVDIVDIEAALDELTASYADKTLNDLPEFSGLNPSIEHFSRTICDRLSDRIKAANITKISVRLWENRIAWASYGKNRP